MVVTKLAQACRAQFAAVKAQQQQPIFAAARRTRQTATATTLQAFCLSALALPGMVTQAVADDSEDEIGAQFSHYEQSPYAFTVPSGSGPGIGSTPGNYSISGNGNVTYGPQVHVHNNLSPLSVDGNQFFARLHLSDRWRLSVGHEEDVWSGATPLLSQPVTMQGQAIGSLSAASFYALYAGSQNLFTNQGKAMAISQVDPANNQALKAAVVDSRAYQVISYASPEIRNQLDAKLGYDWDNAALDVGVGTSVEHDYLSRFINSALRLDFNQKLTTLNFGFSYTGSQTKAHPMVIMAPSFLNANANNLSNINSGNLNSTLNPSFFPSWFSSDPNNAQNQGGWMGSPGTITGDRADTALSMGLSQIINKNDVFSAGVSYTNSSGYQNNPYKGVLMLGIDPNWLTDGTAQQLGINVSPGSLQGTALSTLTDRPWIMENRPKHRNQITLNGGYLHNMEGWDAAWKLNYSFFHDDWNITAHTFEAEWRQDLGSGWMLTPNARYYSQSQAFFFADYFTVSTPGSCTVCDGSDTQYSVNPASIPSYYSSDQRLSAYGSLSGGLSLSKRFAKGLSLELSYQYYDHAGGLKLGGGGEGSFMDFQYYVASAGVRANLGQLANARLFEYGMPGGGLFNAVAGLFTDNEAAGQADHAHMHSGMHQHGHIPAGVMWAHMLDEEDQFMLGYRFMRSTQGGSYLHGTQPVSSQQLDAKACPVGAVGQCTMYNTSMQMDMHMLDIMYAPTRWLSLMLMPTYMDMSMNMFMDPKFNMTSFGLSMYGMDMRPVQYNGGFGDTGAYAMFRLWDGDGQHLHLTQGLTFPTGSIRARAGYVMDGYYAYDMQNGSGTVDYKPSLTYTGAYEDVFWGSQLSGAHRLSTNNGRGWALGDNLQTTAWLGYQLSDWWSVTVRGQYSLQGAIRGSYNNNGVSTVYPVSVSASASGAHNAWGLMPDMYSQNYGGAYGDVGFGLTLTIPHGTLKGNTLSFEWMQPVYTDQNGYQLDRTAALNATWGLAF